MVGIRRQRQAFTLIELQDSPTSDGLGGQFNDQNTKIIRDVDSKPLIIDLNKPEG